MNNLVRRAAGTRITFAVLLIAALFTIGPAAARSEIVAGPVADVTGDGRADVVIRQAGRLYVYPHGGATTSNPWTASRYDTGTSGWDIARVMLLSDATGDGRPDIVTVRTDETLWVYPHNGGTGTAANWTAPYATGITGWNIADWIGMGDLTGDGRPDIAARYRDGSMWVYPHNGATGANANWLGAYSIGVNWNSATALLLGDVNGDGRTDLVARDAGGNLTVHGTGSGARIASGTGWNLANVLLLQDVTGDGRPEITVRDSDGALWVYPHNGATGSNPWTQARFTAGTGWNIASAMMF